MNCSYHPQNFAAVSCRNCNRPLCPACDHRIKGFPFCQDCIVSGVELLQQQPLSINAAAPSLRSSPLVAVVLSLICPGLGAAYNGQNAKALTHFGVFVGLFQMAVLTNGGLPLFVLGFLGMWLFAAVDAFRTARAARFGLAANADDLLTRRLSGNPLAWALMLIALGTVFFLNTMFNYKLPMRDVLPILLIALGLYWLLQFVVRTRRTNELDAFEPQKPLLTAIDNESAIADGNARRLRSVK